MYAIILLSYVIIGLFNAEFKENYSVKKLKEIKKLDENLSFDRFLFFSDAIIAIIITLMVLEIRIPKVEIEELGHAVLEMNHHFIAYLIAFSFLGLLWLEHHKIFRYVERYDNKLIVLNLGMLLFMSLVPFPTALMSSYPESSIGFVIFVMAVGMASFMRYLIIRHSQKVGFINANAESIECMKMVALILPLTSAVACIMTLVCNATIGAMSFLFVPALTKLAVNYNPVIEQPTRKYVKRKVNRKVEASN